MTPKELADRAVELGRELGRHRSRDRGPAGPRPDGFQDDRDWTPFVATGPGAGPTDHHRTPGRSWHLTGFLGSAVDLTDRREG